MQPTLFGKFTSPANDSTVAGIFAHVAGATYKIAVEAGVVKYYQNGTLKYTSTGSPTYPLTPA